MAIHKQRSGKRVVCWPCQQDDCGECLTNQLGEDTLRCHCTCQPECTECAETPRKRRSPGICQVCFTALPLTGVCTAH